MKLRILTLLLFLPPAFGKAQSPRINCTEAGYLLNNARSPESKGQINARMDQGICILSFDEGVQLSETVDLQNLDSPVILESTAQQSETLTPNQYALIRPASDYGKIADQDQYLLPIPVSRTYSEYSDEPEHLSVLSGSLDFDGNVLIVLPEKSAIPNSFPVNRKNLQPYSTGCYPSGIVIAEYSDFIDLSGLEFTDRTTPECDINFFSGEPKAVPKKGKPVKGGQMSRHKRKAAHEKKDDDITPPEPLESTLITSSGAEGEDPPEDKDKKKEDHGESAPMQKKPSKISNLMEEDFVNLDTHMKKMVKKSKKEGFKPENNLQQFRIIHNFLKRATEADMRRIQGMNAYQSLQPHLTSIQHLLDPPPRTAPPPERVPRSMKQKVPDVPPSYNSEDEN